MNGSSDYRRIAPRAPTIRRGDAPPGSAVTTPPKHRDELASSGRVALPLVGPTPSAWVVKWSNAIEAGGIVLDLACGSGRHSRFLAENGFRVLAADIDLSRFGAVAENIQTLQADLEGSPWPFHGRTFDAIVVTNYLHRPRFEYLLAGVRSGGLLIYETFAAGNERFGKPSNPDFLLQPGELRRRVGGDFHILGFEEGEVAFPKPAVTQRICARRQAG